MEVAEEIPGDDGDGGVFSKDSFKGQTTAEVKSHNLISRSIAEDEEPISFEFERRKFIDLISR